MPHWTEELFVEQAEAYRPFLEERTDRAPEEVEDLLELVDDKYDHEPERILDVACGVGRHLVPFAEAGLEAHGVDISPGFVEAARERAESAGVGNRVTVSKGDMRKLDQHTGQYDLVTSIWTSIGYFDRDDNRAVLKGMYDRLAPGGVVVLELTNKDGILSAYDDSAIWEDDGVCYADRREYDPASSRIEFTLYVLDLDEEALRKSFSWEFRAYAPVELRERLADVGFNDIATFASLDGGELTRESTRMVVTGRKPA